MELDFSKLENIAYRGFEGGKAREAKDALIEQGFTVIEGAETPFDGPLPQEAISPASPTKNPAERKLAPFTGIDPRRNYRAMYRAACNFHEQHAPPRVDRAYWRERGTENADTPDAESAYWEETAKDMAATAASYHNDPFLTGLLIAIYAELEREYQLAKQSAVARQAGRKEQEA